MPNAATPVTQSPFVRDPVPHALTLEESMAHTHEFDCRICGAHLDSQKQLDEHNQKEHTRQASGGSGSSVRNNPSGGSGNATNR
jgi:hypothetical protein